MMIDPQSRDLASYLDGWVRTRPPELQAMEAEAARSNFPIIGPASGQFCYLIARLIRATSVFELGSGFGYSTAWFARAVQENGGGVVHHVVWDGELSASARRHLAALGLDHLVEFHVSEAVETLRKTAGPFDLIFNDIDKTGYPDSLPVIASRLRPGGVLLVDNLLWSGKVLQKKPPDAETDAIKRFTRLVMEDPQWVASIVPIRDGILVAQRT
ncbi:MAG: O-methyltransferase [Gemmatimonadales bacterium]